MVVCAHKAETGGFLNHYLKTLVAALGYWSGLYYWMLRRFRRGRVAILCYHNPRPETLACHLEYLSGKYQFVSMDRLVSGGWPKKRERSWIVVTIDDGYVGNYRLLPTLRRYAVRPTIYLCSGIVGTRRRFWTQAVASPIARRELMRIPDGERRARLWEEYGFSDEGDFPGERVALSKAEIEQMSDSVDFGGHTRFHPILPRCDDAACLAEISACRQEVATLSGNDCRHFAFPNGDYTAREVEMTRRCGFSTARTAEWVWMKAGDDRFLLGTIHIPDCASIPSLVGQLCGAGELLKMMGGWQRKIGTIFRSATLASRTTDGG